MLYFSSITMLQDDAESLFLSQSSLFKSSRSYNKWSPTEEGTTLAWKDLNVYIKKKGQNYQRIINGSKL